MRDEPTSDDEEEEPTVLIEPPNELEATMFDVQSMVLNAPKIPEAFTSSE
jgi:hypothetical protein